PKAAIEKFSTIPEEGLLKNLQSKIDLAFGKNSVLEIVSQLEKMSENNDEWAMKTLKAIRRSCPLSVAAAFAAINNAKNLSLIECLQTEYRFAHKALLGTEFYEGVRAAVIDKDRKPKWQPATLEQVTPEMVRDILAPLGKDEWQQKI
ncbi:MAG: enoyl-CoA hydratase/isomerase family protein, partial [Devosiaceae bacterium]|nr:enoyl-CoA hydratase/isomerase family protein [Devosiaceae bacterium]